MCVRVCTLRSEAIRRDMTAYTCTHVNSDVCVLTYISSRTTKSSHPGGFGIVQNSKSSTAESVTERIASTDIRYMEEDRRFAKRMKGII